MTNVTTGEGRRQQVESSVAGQFASQPVVANVPTGGGPTAVTRNPVDAGVTGQMITAFGGFVSQVAENETRKAQEKSALDGQIAALQGKAFDDLDIAGDKTAMHAYRVTNAETTASTFMAEQEVLLTQEGYTQDQDTFRNNYVTQVTALTDGIEDTEIRNMAKRELLKNTGRLIAKHTELHAGYLEEQNFNAIQGSIVATSNVAENSGAVVELATGNSPLTKGLSTPRRQEAVVRGVVSALELGNPSAYAQLSSAGALTTDNFTANQLVVLQNNFEKYQADVRSEGNIEFSKGMRLLEEEAALGNLTDDQALAEYSSLVAQHSFKTSVAEQGRLLELAKKGREVTEGTLGIRVRTAATAGQAGIAAEMLSSEIDVDVGALEEGISIYGSDLARASLYAKYGDGIASEWSGKSSDLSPQAQEFLSDALDKITDDRPNPDAERRQAEAVAKTIERKLNSEKTAALQPQIRAIQSRLANDPSYDLQRATVDIQELTRGLDISAAENIRNAIRYEIQGVAKQRDRDAAEETRNMFAAEDAVRQGNLDLLLEAYEEGEVPRELLDTALDQYTSWNTARASELGLTNHAKQAEQAVQLNKKWQSIQRKRADKDFEFSTARQLILQGNGTKLSRGQRDTYLARRRKEVTSRVTDALAAQGVQDVDTITANVHHVMLTDSIAGDYVDPLIQGTYKTAFTMSLLDSDGEPNEAIVRAAREYSNIHTQNPDLARDYFGEAAPVAYAIQNIARVTEGNDFTEATRIYASALGRKEAEAEGRAQPVEHDLEEDVSDVVESFLDTEDIGSFQALVDGGLDVLEAGRVRGLSSNPLFGADLDQHTDFYTEQVTTKAQELLSQNLGMSPTDAAQYAMEEVRNQFPIVNDQILNVGPGRNLARMMFGNKYAGSLQNTAAAANRAVFHYLSSDEFKEDNPQAFKALQQGATGVEWLTSPLVSLDMTRRGIRPFTIEVPPVKRGATPSLVITPNYPQGGIAPPFSIDISRVGYSYLKSRNFNVDADGD